MRKLITMPGHQDDIDLPDVFDGVGNNESDQKHNALIDACRLERQHDAEEKQKALTHIRKTFG